MRHRTSLRAVSASAMLLLVSLGLAGCEPSQPRAQTAPAPPPKVTVAKPTKRLLADHDEYVGRFVAVDAIEVRARVSGYLDAIHFKDGQIVKKGDLLFTIDRRPFETSLAQAEANLAQARANLAYAEADLERGQGWYAAAPSRSRRSISARRPSASPRPTSQRRRRRCARPTLDLEFTELRAPVVGPDRRPARIGRQSRDRRHDRHHDAARDHQLDRSDPLRVHHGRDILPALRASPARGGHRRPRHRLPVQLKLIDEPKFVHAGRIDFVDNAIDRSSGTIRARAVFANSDGTLHARHVRAHPGRGRGRRAKRCWCPRLPSAPSRCASSCWWSMATTSPGPNTSRSGRSWRVCAWSRGPRRR